MRECYLDQVVAAEVALKARFIAHLAAPLVAASVGAAVHIVVASTSAYRIATTSTQINVIAITQVHIDAGCHQLGLFLASQRDQLGHIDRVVIGSAGDAYPVQRPIVVPVVRAGPDVNLQWAVGKRQSLYVEHQVGTLTAEVRRQTVDHQVATAVLPIGEAQLRVGQLQCVRHAVSQVGRRNGQAGAVKACDRLAIGRDRAHAVDSVGIDRDALHRVLAGLARKTGLV